MRPSKNTVVIGNGRWARTWIETLLEVRPHTGRIIVFTQSPGEKFTDWLRKFNDVRRIETTEDFGRVIQSPYPTIIASAAGTHRDFAVSTLSGGLPTLVEKPLALNLGDARQIAYTSHKHKVSLAASNVFLFSQGLNKFKEIVSARNLPDSILMSWTDAKGETARFDSSVPIFKDVLPHIVGILEYLFEETEWVFTDLEISRGGARANLKLQCGNILIAITIERNACDRQRLLEVTWAQGRKALLNFSREPSQITVEGDGVVQSIKPDLARLRPLASMALSFLESCEGRPFDKRLDPTSSLRSCELSDAISLHYNRLQQHWLNPENLKGDLVGFDDFLYANVEAAQCDSRFGKEQIIELEEQLQKDYFNPIV